MKEIKNKMQNKKLSKIISKIKFRSKKIKLIKIFKFNNKIKNKMKKIINKLPKYKHQ